MKKTALAAAVIMAFSLFSCGSDPEEISDDKKPVPTESDEEEKTADITTALPAAEENTADAVDGGNDRFTLNVETKAMYYGDLILVNNDHPYHHSGSEDLVSIMEKNDETNRSGIFTAVDYSYVILDNVYEPMAEMIDDFYNIYENNTLIIYGSYRTSEFQQQLYDQFTANTENDGEAPIVALPGYSEHESGLAFDFSETVSYDYQGTGDFAWINENCHKYGFIVRYAKNKEDITKYREEPWHFRYVGIPHAVYMTKNDLCLEEYTEMICKEHPYDGEHLFITDDEGREYEVYYYPADVDSDSTEVPVPSDRQYDISGNNIDGFIVTIY